MTARDIDILAGKILALQERSNERLKQERRMLDEH
jgi:hypothetical protein